MNNKLTLLSVNSLANCILLLDSSSFNDLYYLILTYISWIITLIMSSLRWITSNNTANLLGHFKFRDNIAFDILNNQLMKVEWLFVLNFIIKICETQITLFELLLGFIDLCGLSKCTYILRV